MNAQNVVRGLNPKILVTLQLTVSPSVLGGYDQILAVDEQLRVNVMGASSLTG